MKGQPALEPVTTEAQQSHRDSHGPDLLAQFEVCRRLGISDETWRRWRKAGRTPNAIALPSGRLKWRREDIDCLTQRTQPEPRRRYFQSASRHAATLRSIQGGTNPSPVDGQVSCRRTR